MTIRFEELSVREQLALNDAVSNGPLQQSQLGFQGKILHARVIIAALLCKGLVIVEGDANAAAVPSDLGRQIISDRLAEIHRAATAPFADPAH
ncbi:hypothetical protein [Bradyrhizobium sp. HKCCYLR20261]|uniref:hypothetical protein n=1 Tax=Bradyrhizobium sp. HKCCYLR20261 TaxID=3420760 RepID=UPI003EB699BC